MKTLVFYNGKFIPEGEAKMSVLEPALLYGWGVFETTRAYNNRIVYLEEHLKRLKNSSRLAGIKFNAFLKLKQIIRKVIKINRIKDAHMRVILWKAERRTDILVRAVTYAPYPKTKYKKGFHACISDFRQNENSYFSQIKTTSRLFYQLAYLEAKKKKFDEAILLNNRGLIAEGSRSNIFMARGGEVFTPALGCGCLEGVTRKVILDLAKRYGIKAYEARYTVQELLRADEAFLTNSLIGVMPLTYVEGKRIGNGTAGTTTRFFMQEYDRLLKKGPNAYY